MLKIYIRWGLYLICTVLILLPMDEYLALYLTTFSKSEIILIVFGTGYVFFRPEVEINIDLLYLARNSVILCPARV